MNRIYKTIWSVAQRCMVVVSELAKNGAGTVAKSIVLLVIMASQATDTYAINNNLAFVGVQGPAVGNANNYCMNDGTTRLLCAPWSSAVTAVSGDNFGYMSGINNNATGISWAGTSSAGFSFGGISKTYVAGSSQIIVEKNAITFNSDAFTFNGASATVNTTNGLSLSSKKITSLAPGTAGTDAVNVGQLSPVVTALGGGATLNSSTGAVTGPTYTLTGKTYTTVNDALHALDVGDVGMVKVTGPTGVTVGADTGTLTVNFTNSNSLTRRLLGVSNGAVASGSKEGVNGDQLFAIGSGLATALGGGAVVSSATGNIVSIAAPSYALAGLTNSPFSNVGDALAALNTSLGTANTSITNLTTKGTNYFHANSTGTDSAATGADAVAIGSSATAANIGAVALGAGSVTAAAVSTTSVSLAGATHTFAGRAPTSTVSIGASGSERTLTNVAAGRLASDSTDAANGSQLFASNQAIDSIYTSINSGGIGLVKQDTTSRVITVGGETDGGEVSFAATGGGTRKLTGVSNGTIASGSTDAVNGGQLFNANSTVNNLINNGTKYFHTNSTDLDSAASGTNAIAVGTAATATGADAAAIGTGATATAQDAMALGTNTTAASAGDVALGANSVTDPVVATTSSTIAGVSYNFAGGAPASTVSIGAPGSERTLTNVAAGRLNADSTDAVNGSQLFASNQAIDSIYNNISSGGIGLVRQSAAGAPITVGAATDGSQVDFTGTARARTLIGVANGSVASGSTQAVNGGQLYTGNQNQAAYLGGGAGVSTTDGSVTAPSYALTGLSGTPFNNVGSALTALNSGLGATNSNVTSLGNTVNNLTTKGTNYFHANSTGADSAATGADAVAVGTGASASARDAIAIGNVASAGNAGDVALGANSVTAAAVATPSATIAGTTYRFAGDAPASTVSIGAVDSERTLTNVAAGQLSDTSTDAVNGSQLFASNEAIDTLSTTINAGGIGLVRQSAAGAPITVGAATDGTQVDFTGTAGARTLTGVANGTVASGSTQAVNGGQLFDTNNSITNLTNQGTKYFHANSTGADSAATGADAVAVGTGASASSADAIAIGNSASAGNAGDVALGANSVTAAAVATPSAAIAGTVYHFAGDAPASTVSIGAVDSERTLTNVAAGQLSDTSTDAVNGSQLFASNQAIDTLSTTINAGGIGLVRQSAAGAPITVGAATDGTQVNFTGTAGARTLAGVANGTIASGSTQAVNGGQLFDTNNSITNLTNQGTKYFHTNSTDLDSAASGTNAIAVGAAATSTGDDSAAVGTGATATAQDAIALGTNTTAANTGDVALGANSVTDPVVATTSATIAGVTHNFAGGAPVSTVSIGAPGSERTLTNVAAGRLSSDSTDGVNGSQLFASNEAINTLSTTISSGGIGLVKQDATSRVITVGGEADGGEVSFSASGGGTRKLTGVAAGGLAADSTDAVNGSQLFATNGNVSSLSTSVNDLTNNGSRYFRANSTGTLPAVSGNDAVAIGTSATAANAGDVALGANSVTAAAVTTTSAMIAGVSHNFAGGAPASTVSIGAPGSERTLTNVAAGRLSSDSTDGVNGSQLFASNEAINTLSTTINSSGIGLVRQSAAGAPITVGAATDGTQVDFTGTAGSRTLSGVAPGSIASGSTQAINGSQLYSANQNIASALGGGATVGSNGNLTNPSYNIQGSIKTNVGDALGTLDSATTSNTNNIVNLANNINNGSIGLVQQASNASVVTVAATTGGNEVTFAGTNGNRKLTGVAAGALSAQSTEAVNGSQLFAVDQQVIQNTNNIVDLYQNINNSGEKLVTQATTSSEVDIAQGTGGSTVNVAGDEGTRVLTGLSAGVNDSDAVTVGQIKALELQQGNTKQLAVNATGIATASGSNAAAVGSNARSTGVNSTTLGNDTFASGANSTVVGNGAVASGDNSVAMGAFSSATASNSVALGANSIASEANTVSVGSPGNERRITNVAPGVNDTDAVNVYQLDQVQAANNQSFRNINNRVDRLDNKLTAGVASAMAMAGLPQAWEPSSSLVGVSVAGYDDKASLAIGVSAISGNGKWITKLQGSGNSESDFGVSVGIGYQW
ncbi:YadA-like family protein [Pantoea cypripedii]|nr:YadA-like family protein [Pantoea cypripedii]